MSDGFLMRSAISVNVGAYVRYLGASGETGSYRMGGDGRLDWLSSLSGLQIGHSREYSDAKKGDPEGTRNRVSGILTGKVGFIYGAAERWRMTREDVTW